MREEIKQRIEQIRRGEVPEGYKRTKIGIVPEEWEITQLNSISSHVIKKNTNGKIQTTFTNSATQGVIKQTDYFDKEISNKENITSYYVVQENDYIYNPRISVSAPCGPINKSHFSENGVVSPLYTVFRLNGAFQKNKYIEFFFKSSFWHSYMCSIANYGARHDRMNITNDDLFSMPIPFPPLAEQEKIAEILQTQDKVIELQQKKIEELKRLKKVYLSKMFPKKGCNVPEIRFPGFTDAWEQRKLGEMGQTYTGLSGKTKDDFGHGQARFVTYMNVFSNPISNPEMTEPIEIDPKQNEVEVGDVFFTTSSETPEEVGMSSILLEKRGKTYLNSFCFGFRPSEKIDSYYLAYMLRSESTRAKIILLAQGISRYNISKNKVMEIAVSLPSLDEQKMIGQYFSQLDNLITLHQRKLDEEQKKKKTLMQLLLTGIVRVEVK